MQHITPAHQRARHEHTCPTCGKPLKNAKYLGEFPYVFGRDGYAQRVAVYLRCGCKALNEASIDVTDDTGFTDVVDTLTQLPTAAKKITQQTEAQQL